MENKADHYENFSQEQLQSFLEYLKRGTGLCFSPRNHNFVKQQIYQTYKNLHTYQNFKSFLSDLTNNQSNPYVQEIQEKLVIHETRFYRDTKYFTFLKNTVLPRVIKTNSKNKRLSLWITAGSSGQEAYSILFTLLDSYGHYFNDWQLDFYSTDLSNSITEIAKEAIYSDYEMDRGINSNYLREKYFDKLDTKTYQVKEKYRDMINFSTSNLISSYATLPEFDFISCRNVLIYFDEETKKSVIQKLSQKVRNNGYLCLGQTDYLSCQSTFPNLQYEMEKGFPFFLKKS